MDTLVQVEEGEDDGVLGIRLLIASRVPQWLRRIMIQLFDPPRVHIIQVNSNARNELSRRAKHEAGLITALGPVSNWPPAGFESGNQVSIGI